MDNSETEEKFNNIYDFYNDELMKYADLDNIYNSDLIFDTKEVDEDNDNFGLHLQNYNSNSEKRIYQKRKSLQINNEIISNSNSKSNSNMRSINESAFVERVNALKKLGIQEDIIPSIFNIFDFQFHYELLKNLSNNNNNNNNDNNDNNNSNINNNNNNNNNSMTEIDSFLHTEKRMKYEDTLKISWYRGDYYPILIVFPFPFYFREIFFDLKNINVLRNKKLIRPVADYLFIEINIQNLKFVGCCDACITYFSKKPWRISPSQLQASLILCRDYHRNNFNSFTFEMKLLCTPLHHFLNSFNIFFQITYFGTTNTPITYFESNIEAEITSFRGSQIKVESDHLRINLREVEKFTK
jgi:hypothetical protein